jgi:4-amino-4-deoxy-L-arabinose transferase-like glycosyltransferase
MNATIPLKQTAALSGDKPTPSTPSPWEWAALVFILLVGAALRLWKIDQNGTGNPYYAAVVRSMMMNWHNFFFVSFDPVGFVTVDKPPVSLWIQTAFAKLFGYRGFTLILPQILEGLGSLILVYHLVRRRFGSGAALFSATAIALSPVSVAVDRYNNTDACLVLVMLLSAWALSLAAETGNRKLLYLALILAGVGFNTKMMAAFVALPAFYLVYFAGSPNSWLRRLGDLTIGTLILLLVALSWPLAVDLTPPEQRPFVGSTQDNSMIGLSLGWNGFQRLLARGRRGFPQNPRTGNSQAAVTGTNGSPSTVGASPDTATSSSPASIANSGTPGAAPASQGFGRRRGGGGGMNTGTPGLLRLADKNMAGQIAWFLPLALLGFWAQARRIRFSLPLAPSHQALVLWLGWFFTYAVVFSFMRGAMHAYYLVLLVPPLAALAGIGINALWFHFKEGRPSLLLLGLILTTAWQAFIVFQYPDWKSTLLPILFLGTGLALAGLFFLPSLMRQKLHLSSGLPWALGLGLCTLFLCPTFWALTPVLGSGQSVEANPDLLSGGQRGGMFQGFGARLNTAKLLDYLKAHRQGEEYLLVSQNSQLVAPIIIETGEPVVAIGGFMGGDPILTANQFAEKVKEGQFRYMLLQSPPANQGRGGGNGRGYGGNGGGFGGGFGFGRGGGQQAEIAKWVRENGTPVDPTLWKPAIPPAPLASQNPAQGPGGAQGFQGGFGGRRGGLANLQLYDLRPDKETKTASIE